MCPSDVQKTWFLQDDYATEINQYELDGWKHDADLEPMVQ